MIEMFLEMPQAMQIFLVIAMVIGLLVMWRFRKFVIAIALGAVAIFISLKSKASKK